MISEFNNLITSYYEWLKDKTVLKQLDDWYEITTPYLDSHNDYIQIYAKRDNGSILLTDDSYTINDLEDNGCKIESGKRKDLLNITLNGFGIKLGKDKDLYIKTDDKNFAQHKHNLLQAILAVNDMFYLSKSNVANIFYEDVKNWLDCNDIRFTDNFHLIGKTGYTFKFDFIIPKSKVQPERIIKTINRVNKDAIQGVVLSWLDTRETRNPNSELFAFLNDDETKISKSNLDALKNHSIIPVEWQNREDYVERLAA